MSSKMYTIKLLEHMTQKLNGVKKSVLGKNTLIDFYLCLTLTINLNLIRFHENELFTIE